MLSTITLVVAGLSTANKIGLAIFGLSFVAFALISSFVMPRRNPDFPGRRLGWYLGLCVLFFVAMITAVLVFDQSTTAATTTTASTTSPTATVATKPGNPTAGQAVFETTGCGGCHTLKAAGATGTVGPNLDQLKPPLARIVLQVNQGGGPMPAYKGQLTDQQIQDVSAYVYASTH
ncbi:MAG TPA: cytochrome c [Gaiellaceae bacterium]|nr:cytochrome c [Gaiellaceae bacterium]